MENVHAFIGLKGHLHSMNPVGAFPWVGSPGKLRWFTCQEGFVRASTHFLLFPGYWEFSGNHHVLSLTRSILGFFHQCLVPTLPSILTFQHFQKCFSLFSHCFIHDSYYTIYQSGLWSDLYRERVSVLQIDS